MAQLKEEQTYHGSCQISYVHKKISKIFLGVAIYLISRMPSNVIDFEKPILKLPHNALVSNLPPKIFGCTCFMHNQDKTKGELDCKALKCVFIGYANNKKGLYVIIQFLEKILSVRMLPLMRLRHTLKNLMHLLKGRNYLNKRRQVYQYSVIPLSHILFPLQMSIQRRNRNHPKRKKIKLHGDLIDQILRYMLEDKRRIKLMRVY